MTLASRRFSATDYWAVFGAYLGTGLCYVLLAILAAWALPAERLGRALLFVGGAGGLFMLSSADLYPPAASLRLTRSRRRSCRRRCCNSRSPSGTRAAASPRSRLPLVWGVDR